MKKVLHILLSGSIGGIEVLNKEIYLHSRHDNYFCFMFGGGKIADEMKDEGANVHIAGTRNPLKLLCFIKNLVKEYNIDVVVVHNAAPLAWIIATVITMLYKIPIYIYIHGAIQDALRIGYSKWIKTKKLIFKIASKKAKCIIAISEYVSKTISDMYPDIKDKITVIYNGVDISKYTPNKNNNNKMTLMYVGRLFYWKGVNLLVEAMSKIQSDCKCIIIGDGEEREKLEQLSEKLGVKNKIEFAGIQRNIQQWHHKADVFIHPAIWEEGFGITLVEAMASGLPCIAFRKGAIPEIIDDNKNGFIVDDVSSEALAEKIDCIYNIKKNDLEWSLIRKNAEDKSKTFSIEKMVGAVDTLISTD